MEIKVESTTNINSKLTANEINTIIGTTLAWIVDAFDYLIVTFIAVDIMKNFNVSAAIAGSVISVTVLARLFGAAIGGTFGDYAGRKLPLLTSIIWFAVFEFLSGFSWTFAVLYAFRFLFGLGMGSMYSNGVTLLMETVPEKKRGLASGFLEIGFPAGAILTALVYAWIYPTGGWRWLFFTGAIIALLVTIYLFFILKESPMWLMRKKQSLSGIERIPIINLFKGVQAWDTIHSILANSAFLVLYYSIAAWYPTFLKVERHFSTDRIATVVILLNVSAVVGSIIFGRLSDLLGRRWVITVSAIGTIVGAPLFVAVHSMNALVVGAIIIGFFGPGGAWSVNAAYTAEHFPTKMRAAGHGLTYNAGNALGGIVTPILVGLFSVKYGFGSVMTIGVLISAVALIILAWIWRETKDMDFSR